MLALQLWDRGGRGDDVVVIANVFHEPQDDDVIIQARPLIQAGPRAVVSILAGAMQP